MAVFSFAKVHSSLTKKGFVEEPGDHHFYCLHVDGKKTAIRTKLSRNKQEVGDPLISAMSKQTHLNKKQFADLVNCPLSKEEYQKILKVNKLID